MIGTCEMRSLNQMSNIRRNFHCFRSRFGKVVFDLKLSNLIDSDVASHIQSTLELNSAHVIFDVWTGVGQGFWLNSIINFRYTGFLCLKLHIHSWLILGLEYTVVFLILVFYTSFSIIFGILEGLFRVFWYSTTPPADPVWNRP